MAAFASCRRSGWVRLLVVILCALFIFAMLGAPPAQALGVESVAVFGLASVLSAATAALGFKLASNEQGQATLQKMVQDFKTVAWATGFVLVGSKLNGLQNGMDYIKMQVQNGKTYLDSRIFAWVQQWLAQNGVYNSGSFVLNDYSSSVGKYISFPNKDISYYISFFPADGQMKLNAIISHYNLNLSDRIVALSYNPKSGIAVLTYSTNVWTYYQDLGCKFRVFYHNTYKQYAADYESPAGAPSIITAGSYECWGDGSKFSGRDYGYSVGSNAWLNFWLDSSNGVYYFSNIADGTISSNNTGLSGTDTLGKDVVDLTLDQVLQKLKEWAQDWFDAGADSATNAATGALDLPLTVATGAATANPSIAEDGPLVWFPSFGVSVPTLRTGETDTKTVDQGKENAASVETSTVDVAENQSVIDSLVNWALGYISPDTGLFSKFPLCVPYDAYLLVTSSLGVDAVGSDSIFGASPGDLDGVVNQDIETYSDFQPIINIKHDFQLDGATYPIELTIDLTPWQPLVTFFREGMALILVAELIGAEFKRIRGH